MAPPPVGGPSTGSPAPLSILLVENLERYPREVCTALAQGLESGRLGLPGGQQWPLQRSILFVTSRLCADEILDDSSQIGFSGTPASGVQGEEPEPDRLYQVCHEKAERQFGEGLMAQLDELIVFDPIQEEQLPEIVDRRFSRLQRWLARRGIECEMDLEARALLLQKGRHNLRLGARDLVRAHREHVEFPLADLTMSRPIAPGGKVVIEHREGEDQLHFTVAGPPRDGAAGNGAAGSTAFGVREIPVQ